MKKKRVILIAIIVIALLCLGTYQIYKQPVQANVAQSAKTLGQNKGGSQREQGEQAEQGEQEEQAKEESESIQNEEQEKHQQEGQGDKQEEESEVFRAGKNRQTATITTLTGLDTYSSSIVLQYAEQYNLKPSLLLAMMRVESNFYQYAVGKSQDRGYFQIIPASEKAMVQMFGSEIGVTYDPERIFDPEYNIGLAAAYIHWLQNKYKNNPHRVLSEYNKGPGKMAVYYKENGTYETVYSQKVVGIEQKYEKSLSY